MGKSVVLETKRLILRELDFDDFDNLTTILQDEKAMYAYEHAFSDEEVREWLERQIRRYGEYGMGLLAIIEKDSGEFIGQCGITKQEVDGESVFEIGYLIRRKYWHMGYAIESASAMKNHAFSSGIEKVYSIIRTNNIASQRVAIRNGMLPEKLIVKHYYGMDMPHIVFSVKKEDVS